MTEREHEASNCFGCGERNPIGLHLRCAYEGEAAKAEIVLRENYEGYPGVVHGGIITTMLDEIMAKAVYRRLSARVVTADMHVIFRAPARVNEVLRLSGYVRRSEGRKYYTYGTVEKDGTLLAEAKGLFIRVGAEH
ncbi:MAG: PaaI family thioesterase [Peptococcaceae bacterium]|nr:PaaI family thioesterase [Peptococcaceae bacterium]